MIEAGNRKTYRKAQIPALQLKIVLKPSFLASNRPPNDFPRPD